MVEFVWNQKYSVNIREIDTQHQKFVEILNRFNKALESGQGRDIVDSTIEELWDYAGYHFRTEEELLARYGYPKYEEHKQEHEYFREKIGKYLPRAQDLKGNRLALTVEVSNFMINWLTNHIMKTDKRYSAYLNGKGVY